MTSVNVEGLSIKSKETYRYWINNISIAKVQTTGMKVVFGEFLNECSANAPLLPICCLVNFGQTFLRTTQTVLPSCCGMCTTLGQVSSIAEGKAWCSASLDTICLGQVGVVVNNRVQVQGLGFNTTTTFSNLQTDATFMVLPLGCSLVPSFCEVLINTYPKIKGQGNKITKGFPQCNTNSSVFAEGLRGKLAICPIEVKGNSIAYAPKAEMHLFQGTGKPIGDAVKDNVGKPHTFSLGNVKIITETYVNCAVYVKGFEENLGVVDATVEATAIFNFGRG